MAAGGGGSDDDGCEVKCGGARAISSSSATTSFLHTRAEARETRAAL
jgi:hypothetical protein